MTFALKWPLYHGLLSIQDCRLVKWSINLPSKYILQHEFNKTVFRSTASILHLHFTIAAISKKVSKIKIFILLQIQNSTCLYNICIGYTAYPNPSLIEPEAGLWAISREWIIMRKLLSIPEPELNRNMIQISVVIFRSSITNTDLFVFIVNHKTSFGFTTVAFWFCTQKKISQLAAHMRRRFFGCQENSDISMAFAANAQ